MFPTQHDGQAATLNVFDAAPPYTVVEVLEDLIRASLLEAARGQAVEKMKAHLQTLMQVSYRA